MKLKLTILFFCISLATFCQTNEDASYKNYTTKDGLAGNRVYAATQDKDGFMWFATETGVSRFDGTNFKNFTVAQGLPDNDIINIFADSKGRIWMCPFKNEVCYFYKGKIYNKTNDSLLSKLNLESFSNSIVEDEAGNIVVHNTRFLAVLNYPEKKVSTIATVTSNEFFMELLTYKNEVFVATDYTIYQINNGILKKYFRYTNEKTNFGHYVKNKLIINGENIFLTGSYLNKSLNQHNIVRVNNVNYKKDEFFIKDAPNNNSFYFKDSILFLSGLNGVKAINVNNKNKAVKELFKGIEFNKVYIDGSNRNWLLSNFSGVFLKQKSSVKTLDQKKTHYITSITNHKDILFIGGRENEVLIFDKKKLGIVGQSNLTKFNTQINSIVVHDNNLLVGSTSGIFKLKLGLGRNSDYQITQDLQIEPNQSFTPINTKSLIQYPNFVLASTSFNLLKFDPRSLLKFDTIYKYRTLCALYQNGFYFAGTINGLYKIDKNKNATYLGTQHPLLKRRIVDLTEGLDGTIWVITADEGVVGYKEEKITAHIKEENGLASNICKTAYIADNYLWVGTVNGMSKIAIGKVPFKVVTNYSTADGLISNDVNAILVDGDMVYVGTSEGLNYFNQTEISKNSACLMRILDITVSGKSISFDSTLINLKNNDNNIRIDFVGISYSSNGDVKYNYKLEGLDTAWQTTTAIYLAYPSLPSGSYTFLIEAIDKFGNKSEQVRIPFEIEKKWTEKWWFWTLLILSIGGLLYWLVMRRIKFERNRRTAEVELKQKVLELEQMALKAQMNPHFTFNCLNSIQQFVIDSDVAGANKFISSFAKLIRKTLDNSSREFISLAEEESYLNNYLELETKRFEFPIEYEIKIDDSIDKEDAQIAPMLLQPFIENAVRHGVKNKKDGTGEIKLLITGQTNNYTCKIIDNGVGRAMANDLKGGISIEYQSKGMNLTERRIEMINLQGIQKINLTINDLFDTNDTACGTEIIITITQN